MRRSRNNSVTGKLNIRLEGNKSKSWEANEYTRKVIYPDNEATGYDWRGAEES